MDLRPYQQLQTATARDAIRRGVKSILIQGATGSGKTCIAAFMLKSARDKNLNAWLIVHRSELVRQSVEALTNAAGVTCGVISPQYPVNPYEPIQVCMVGSIRSRAQRLKKPNLIIMDECFPAATLVDGRPIADIRPGDHIRSWNERGYAQWSTVTETMKRAAPARLLRIVTENREVYCTETHPFLDSDNHWRDANQLQTGDYVHVMRDLRRPNGGRSKMPGLLQCNIVRKESTGFPSANAGKESNAESGNAPKSERHSSENWAQTKSSWRKWKRIATARALTIGRIVRMAGGIYSSNQSSKVERRALYSLQNRLGAAGIIAWRRSRRELPLFIEQASPRQEERILLAHERVDSVEILEQGSDGRFERVCPDGYVYNFEVDETHSYTANGFIVHNCHHQAAKTWQWVRDAYPGAVFIGLTATPERLDGQGLGRWFQEMIVGPSVTELTQQGFLSRYRMFAASNHIDLSHVHTQAGDFNRRELSDVLQKSAVIGDAVKEYRKHADGLRGIVFAYSIESSREIAAQFLSAGIPAVHVDGETPDYERRRAIEDFREGRVKIVSNCELFGEGVDIPAIEACFLLRPTQSLGLYLQQVGRALRPFPGKQAALIFDHAGNRMRHGLPDDDREWSLEGTTRREREAVRNDRQCRRCYSIQNPGARVCRNCGHVFTRKEREVEQKAGELREMTEAEIQAEQQARRLKFLADQKRFRALEELETKRGYKPGWARHVFDAQQNKARANGRN